MLLKILEHVAEKDCEAWEEGGDQRDKKKFISMMKQTFSREDEEVTMRLSVYIYIINKKESFCGKQRYPFSTSKSCGLQCHWAYLSSISHFCGVTSVQ